MFSYLFRLLKILWLTKEKKLHLMLNFLHWTLRVTAYPNWTNNYVISEKKQVTWLHGNQKLLFCLTNFGSVCDFGSWIPWERRHSMFRLLNNMRKFHRFFPWNSSFERINTSTHQHINLFWSSSVRPSEKTWNNDNFFFQLVLRPSGSLDNLSFIRDYMRINKTRSEFSF